MVPQARALADAGHEVAFATAADFCPSIEKAGFPAFPAGISLADQLSEAGLRVPEAALAPGKERFETFVPRMLAGVAAPARLVDLVPLLADWRPDVLLHDETELGGPVAAAGAGIPWADQSVGILRPLAMARLAGQVLAPVCAERGVDIGEFAGLFRYLYLDVCPPRLQSDEIDQIATAQRVHNQSIGNDADELPASLRSLPAVPTVYVSLGTIFNRDPAIFGAILEGIGGEEVNVIVTIGPGADPAALGPQPDNVHIEGFIPQSLLLPRCDVVVNQGGTAILDILGHGKPLLVLPRGANQFHNAEACVASGAARALLPAEVDADSVRDGVRALLEEPSYRNAAAEVAADLAAMPGPDHGVRLLERLAAERAPIPSP
ncbi:MAG: glycosyltransferase family 1 protein [Acidimicrobiia bacterium]|nr:glycosyltransferase family 1 protein [Acidimicrobiia bacterium]